MSNDKFQAAFLEEASELLEQLETLLIDLENAPDDRENLEATFRVMHTLKGAAGMFGFQRIESFTHDLETAFDLLREGKLTLNETLIDLSLRSRDQLLLMLGDEAAIDQTEIDDITRQLKTYIGAEETAENPETPEQSSAEGQTSLFLISVKPDQDLLLNGTNPLHLLEDLNELGQITIKAIIEKLPDLEGLNPEQCYLTWEILLLSSAVENDIRDVFIFVEDECDVAVKLLGTSESAHVETIFTEISQSFISNGVLDTVKLDELLIEHGKSAPQVVENENAPTQQNSPSSSERKSSANAALKSNRKEQTIKVGSRKLDELVNLVGELVSLQARLDQLSQTRGDIELTAIAESFNRLTMQLRDSALDMRMLPIGTLFNKFSRLTRDLARELNKEINLTTSGEDTELDKTVIEQLNDPMVHLIRNSADHGIETPEERLAAGKPAQGKVHLSAEHVSGHVLVKISDDGKGLDREKIFKKGIEKGLVNADANLTDKEVFNLILEPGFSTAETLTKVSGRGVGMDVVRRTIEALRGTIEVDSTLGEGSVITLKLPLTLAIIDGLLVQIGSQPFVIPLNTVNECLEIPRENLGDEKRLINLRGSLVPYINLRQYFEIVEEAPEIQQVVVTSIGDRQVGMLVDEVLGQHQTVIKSLGPLYQDVQGVAGATILGNGEVALILDLQALNRLGTTENLLEKVLDH